MNKKRDKSTGKPKARPQTVILTANEIHLTDSTGATRATLACDGIDGAPVLRFFDGETHTDRLVIGLTQNGSGITLRHASGAAHVGIYGADDNRIGVSVFDQDGKIAFAMVVHPDRARQFSCHNESEKVVWQVP
jgi:hypothetical protein